MIGAGLLGETAIVSSFGAESAVLLHLVAQVAPDMPVLFLDTGKHFPETLAYRDELAAKLKLNIVNLTPDAGDLAAKDTTELRWSYDPDGCCEIRKVKPVSYTHLDVYKRQLDPVALAITIAAMAALFRFSLGMLPTLAACAAAGLAYRLLAA